MLQLNFLLSRLLEAFDMAVSFKNPPLNEVAIGYTFLPRPDLLIPHLGRFWAEIDKTYPRCQHAAPIVDNINTGVLGDLPLPRIWFTSEDDTRLVQLQQDRLLVNWRDTGAGTPYVRFPAVRAEFERVQDLFRTYVERLTSEAIHPATYNLTYVNIIKQGEGWTSTADIGRVFPHLRWHGDERFLPLPSDVGWKGTFPLPDGFGSLTAQVQLAKLVRDNQPILRFELAANSGSLGGNAMEFGKWVELAHHWIVHSFKDLTGEEMHRKFWLIEDGES